MIQSVCYLTPREGIGPGGTCPNCARNCMHGMLAKDKKAKIIKKYQTHAGDTGSSEVQIAILSAEIDELSGHLKAHHKDHSSRRGLLRKVGERRRLLRFLKKENSASYEELVKKLKLKQAKQFAPSVAAVEADDHEFEDEAVIE